MKTIQVILNVEDQGVCQQIESLLNSMKGVEDVFIKDADEDISKSKIFQKAYEKAKNDLRSGKVYENDDKHFAKQVFNLYLKDYIITVSKRV